MRKALTVVEYLAWGIALTGFFLLWNQQAGGGILLIVGLGTLSIVYFLGAQLPVTQTAFGSATAASRNDGDFRAPIVAPEAQPSFLLDTLSPKIMGISGSVILIGTLFKLLNWNGWYMMLLVGTVVMLVQAVLLLIKQRTNARALILTAIGGAMLAVSPETLVRQFNGKDPVLVEKMIYQMQNPHDRAAAEDLRLYRMTKRSHR
jgi:hypothetical protein